MTKTNRPKPGDQFHVLKSGFPISRPHINEIAKRGDQFTVTEQLILDSLDRNNESWLDLLHDPEGQIKRYGHVAFAPGEAPAGLQPWEPNSPEADMARDSARTLAFAEADPQKRAEKLAEVYRVFGRKQTSRTLSVITGDRERSEREERERGGERR